MTAALSCRGDRGEGAEFGLRVGGAVDGGRRREDGRVVGRWGATSLDERQLSGSESSPGEDKRNEDVSPEVSRDAVGSGVLPASASRLLTD